MNPKLNNICKYTKKIIYSEPAAIRAVDAVDGACRYYVCDSCGGFHITSIRRTLAVLTGLVSNKTEASPNINMSDVNARINEINKKKEIRINNL